MPSASDNGRRASAPAMASRRAARPRIGVTSSPLRSPTYYDSYLNAIAAAGAEPVPIAPWSSQPSPAEAAGILAGIDGLFIPGGWDVDPLLYGEERGPHLGDLDPDLDRTEMVLVQGAVEGGMPVFGICRGEQLINVALGGTLHQHIPGHDMHGKPRDFLAHAVEVQPDTEFGRTVRAPSLMVNSLHHQAVKELAPGLRATAHSPDGMLEGLESDNCLVVAVQCHPEELVAEHSWAQTLFHSFVNRVRAGVSGSRARSTRADSR